MKSCGSDLIRTSVGLLLTKDFVRCLVNCCWEFNVNWLLDLTFWHVTSQYHKMFECLYLLVCNCKTIYTCLLFLFSKKDCFIVHSAQIFFLCVYLNYKLWSTHNMHSHSTCLSWAIFMDLVVKRRWWCPYACLKRFYYLCRYLRSIYAFMKLVPPQFLLWLEILVVVVWW